MTTRATKKMKRMSGRRKRRNRNGKMRKLKQARKKIRQIARTMSTTRTTLNKKEQVHRLASFVVLLLALIVSVRTNLSISPRGDPEYRPVQHVLFCVCLVQCVLVFISVCTSIKGFVCLAQVPTLLFAARPVPEDSYAFS